MRSQILIFSLVLISLLMSGCGGASPTPNTVTTPNTNANSVNPLETTKKTAEPTTNEAPTLAPVFKAYCAALEKGDEAGLRQIYSAETLKSFEGEMKREKIKSLVKLLETEKTTSAQCSIRNEVISGDSATAEIKTAIYRNGFKIIFVKEGGEWKMTTRSPDIDSVKQAASNANTSK